MAAYFFEHRGKFDIGVNAKSLAVASCRSPASAGFRAVDKAKFTQWIFNNRHAVWAMLYGSMKTGKG